MIQYLNPLFYTCAVCADLRFSRRLRYDYGSTPGAPQVK